MSDPDPDIVTIHDLKEAVGSLFFLWANVERAMAEARKCQGSTPEHTSRAKLDAWATGEESPPARQEHLALVRHVRAEMIEALAIRNGFAHGLTGWHAHLGPSDPEANYRISLGNKDRAVTYRDLVAWTRYLEMLATSLDRLTGAARKNPLHTTVMYQDIRNLLTEAAPPGRPPAP